MSAQIRTGSALLACLLTAAMAVPAWSDTLILRNGTTFSGTLTGANTNTLTFRDRDGRTQRFAVRDVESMQFGDAYRRDNRYPDQGYSNQGHRGYDQARMERVVLPAGTEIAVRTNERIDVKDVVKDKPSPRKLIRMCATPTVQSPFRAARTPGWSPGARKKMATSSWTWNPSPSKGGATA